MKTKKTKKGFTIVELVIVIAVIAILAAVLIPTFTNVINSANESVAMQSCRSEWSNFLGEVATDESSDVNYLFSYNENYANKDTDSKYTDTISYTTATGTANFVVLSKVFDPDNEYTVVAGTYNTSGSTYNVNSNSYIIDSGSSYNSDNYKYATADNTTIYTVTIGSDIYLLGAESVAAADTTYSKSVSYVAIYKLYALTASVSR